MKVADATYFLPTMHRDAQAEYRAAHIPGAVRFDIDDIADSDDPLPHMLPDAAKFSSRVRKLGLGDGVRVVLYDNNRYSASARAWWMFRVFGHDDVAVLDGGLGKWRAEGRPVDDAEVTPREAHFTARTNNLLVRDLEQMRANLVSRRELVIDARAAGRFAGTEPEPRAGLRAGHIPGSVCLPYTDVIRPDGTLMPADELRRRFEAAGIDGRPIATTCGSGRDRRHAGARAVRDRRARGRGLRRLVDRMGRPLRHAGRDLRMTEASGAAPLREGWREDNSALFIDYGRAFTPERERQQEIVCELVASVAPRRVVELCCGSGDLLQRLLERLPEMRALALDGSPAMLAKAGESCAAHRDRLEAQLFDLAARDWRRLAPAPDAICSSLAVHHLDGDGKRQLFADLHTALRPGGIFVLADLIRPDSEAGWRIAADDWDHAVALRSSEIYGDDRAQRKFAELRWNLFRWPEDNTIDHPSTVAEHVAWLTAAGFAAIELHWLVAGHAIFSARKP